MKKVWAALVVAFLVVIAAARFAYTVSSDTGNGPIQQAWAQNRIEFVAWNNNKWTTWIHDGEFELAPEDNDNWSRHANDSIAFFDWQGAPWQAKIDGDAFVLAPQGNWEGEIVRTEAIRYRDWSGNNQLRTIADINR
mgnify:CR=1 FL=1